MAGVAPDLLRAQMRLVGRWVFSSRASWEAKRRRLDLVTRFPGPPRGTRVVSRRLAGVHAEEVTPPGAGAGRVLLYFHGGGYAVGSPATVRGLAARIAAAARARACVVDYRLAPEHPHPAAVEDARAVWDALVGEGADPARVAVAGDSAGGGLTLALALGLRDDGRPPPGALGLVCPWLDLTPEAVAARAPAPREPILSEGILARFTEAYLAGGADAADPLVSPLHADLAGLPPVVVHSGGDDLIRADADRFEERARAAGVEVEHVRHPGLWHDFHVSAPLLAGPGSRAPAELGEALGRRLG